MLPIVRDQEKTYGLIAGISLIVMAVAAGFSYGYVYTGLVVDSPDATIQNIMYGKTLFIAGFCGWIVIFFTDLVVALALYKFFGKTAKLPSMLTALLRIVYTVFLGFAILQLYRVIPKIPANSENVSFSLTIEVGMLFHQFENYWSVGLIIFGFHLAGLGYLSVKSQSVPDILGYLLYLGGAGYSLIHLFKQLALLSPDLITKAENILSLPMALAELLLAVWLIYIGFKKKKNTAKEIVLNS